MNYTFEDICAATGGIVKGNKTIALLNNLLIDSRKINKPASSVFFALKGARHNGHKYIAELYQSGVKAFVISDDVDYTLYPDAGFIVVTNVLTALQNVAAYHRAKFNIPIIGITGSNGKTTVKEWLYQLLNTDYNITRSPKSYNSQVGVPLSVWELNEQTTLGIIEAGISTTAEMPHLQKIIKPTIGILTTIGEAHSEGFKSKQEKIKEKLSLFITSEVLIYHCDDVDVLNEVIRLQAANKGIQLLSISTKSADAGLYIKRVNREPGNTTITALYNGSEFNLTFPFTDEASINNCITCLTTLLYLGIEINDLQNRFNNLTAIEMRLMLKAGINNCDVINDSYNSDLNSVKIALDFLEQQTKYPHKTLIISDVLESGKTDEQLYEVLSDIVNAKNLHTLIGIGEHISQFADLFKTPNKQSYSSTAEFINNHAFSNFSHQTILLKGARSFGFENIARKLEQKAHETTLNINLTAIEHNLNYFRSKLKPGTKLMVMVKAYSYGSGTYEIAKLLQFHRVDYLGVAYADEGVALRQAGITLPIMVMNPDESSFNTILEYNLQPDLYSLAILNGFIKAVKETGHNSAGVHLELDTGMHRLGFTEEEIPQLILQLKDNPELEVKSIFSHLSASDEAEHDEFTRRQIFQFTEQSNRIKDELNYPVLRHILNSTGIIRFADNQMDMVRLGIGLYGIDPSNEVQQELREVTSLTSHISQIRTIKPHESVGYSRKGVSDTERRIGILAIGYADGLNRALSNGNGYVVINGQKAPIVGNICMDMTMVDLTGLYAKEGDEVTLFGEDLPVQEVAERLHTIPYEILTNVSQRVKRVYWQE